MDRDATLRHWSGSFRCHSGPELVLGGGREFGKGGIVTTRLVGSAVRIGLIACSWRSLVSFEKPDSCEVLLCGLSVLTSD